MSPKIRNAPSTFNGTLGELYEGWAKEVLLTSSDVEEFHQQFRAYLDTADPLYPVRMVKGQVRGQILRTESGGRLCPTDNSPAWWIHYQISSGQFRQFTSFAELIAAIPSHLFQVRMPENVNKAGWHVAHIFDAKDRNIQFHQWDRHELRRRAARNIHPCNYFYLPKWEWQQYGGSPTVISFFYDKFKTIYRTIWEDFLELVDGTPLDLPPGAGEYRYASSPHKKPQQNLQNTQQNLGEALPGYAVQYSFPRLCFRADVIEPLNMDDKFCIVTKDGTFAMTKREFYQTFPSVIASESYR